MERPQEPEAVEVHSEAVFSSHCTHEFAAAVAACTDAQTRPAKDESSKTPNMDQGGYHEVLPLAEDLFTVDGCQRRESWFSSDLGPMRNLSSSRLPYSHTHQVELVH